MDLQIKLQDTTLKIRAAGLVKTSKGYLFEKNEGVEHVFPIGGKIMLNESSEEAIKREIKEEIGMDVKEVKLRSVIENFYGTSPDKVHELCFVYEVQEEFTGTVPPEFVEVSFEDVDKNNIKPTSITEILKSENNSFKHFVIK
jgi:8-oxo-dGTP pyrophosphatase MutT (NUDIX family)